jgi:hypothetical protein
MASDRLIHFVCTSRAHRGGPDPGLTQHDGEWALCSQLLANGHEWYDTGGLPVREAVAQWRGLVGPVEETQPTAPAA